ncbi:MAG: MFS transporter [Erythrobacter sp.]|nr:MFS transporter [Erythrobacter sp.]
MTSPTAPAPDALLTRRQEYALALAIAVVTANAYYIHPIIGDVADSFGVSDRAIGWVPALNQLALALGILLLLPLGDRYSNRRLTMLFVAGQCVGLVVMTLARDLVWFTAGSTWLGFFTIAPYILPAYASKRVAPERLGQVTAILTAGVLFGILVARVGAGVLAEQAGWRSVYWVASALMLAITLVLPRIMPKLEAQVVESARRPYLELVGSVFPLLRSHPEIIISGAIQGLGFGQFIALWLALALHLTSPVMGYGTDVVGYLAGFAAISVFSTPVLGTWADRIGARRSRAILALVQTSGSSLLIVFGASLWLLVIPVFISSTVGPGIDVSSRMTFLAERRDLRTRLTTIYIVMMFIGGGIGSIAGTALYDAAGWQGTAIAITAACALMTTLAFAALWLYGPRTGPAVANT